MNTKTIDMTPSWEGAVSYLILILESGTSEGKQIAKEELRRMAKLADLYAESVKD